MILSKQKPEDEVDEVETKTREVLGEVIDIWEIVKNAENSESESEHNGERCPRQMKSNIMWSTINTSKQACDKWLTLQHKHVD